MTSLRCSTASIWDDGAAPVDGGGLIETSILWHTTLHLFSITSLSSSPQTESLTWPCSPLLSLLHQQSLLSAFPAGFVDTLLSSRETRGRVWNPDNWTPGMNCKLRGWMEQVWIVSKTNSFNRVYSLTSTFHWISTKPNLDLMCLLAWQTIRCCKLRT